jgi:hypothetical protein
MGNKKSNNYTVFFNNTAIKVGNEAQAFEIAKAIVTSGDGWTQSMRNLWENHSATQSNWLWISAT